MLEAYKNVDGLAAAWRRVARQVPDARLVVVGRGTRHEVIERLVRDLPEQVEQVEWLEPEGVARALDEATLLVLPSWPEGLGRVVIEAFARARGVVATDAGGIPDLVRDGVEGLLVPRADEDALVQALVRVLSDRGLAERLGAAARARFAEWDSTPATFAASYRQLVDATIARCG
jgi:glycosyltransferase involved in cell wall biosynthesis